MALKRIDTATISAPDRISAWEKYMQTEHFNATCTPLEGQAFWGVQTNAVLDRIAIAEVRTSSHVLEHRPEEDRSEGQVLVSILLEGEAVLGQAGLWLHHGPGDALLTVPALPFTYVSPRSLHALVLRIPERLFELIHGERLRKPRLIPAEAGARRFDQNTLIKMLEHWISGGPSHDARGLQDKVLNVLASLLDTGRGTGVGRAHYLAALAFVFDHQQEADLDPGRVARALKLSPRQLHRIFAQQGTSVMAEVTERRLQRAMLMVHDPNLAHLSIAEIGYRCGFSGPAVFSRLFRRRYGTSPQLARRHPADA